MVNYRETTVSIDGLTAVEYARKWDFYAVRNDGEETIYISSARPDCTAGTDGVVSVSPGASMVIINVSGKTLYLNGSGQATVIGQSQAINPFKTAGKGGESADYKNGDYSIFAEYENEIIGAAEEVIS